MVIVNKVGGQQITRETEFRGLSTDIKPITDVPNGSIFYEMDTVDVYMFDIQNQKWLKQ
mgnify:CR=1 FL=1